MDIILSSINSLVKHNNLLEEQLNIMRQKLDKIENHKDLNVRFNTNSPNSPNNSNNTNNLNNINNINDVNNANNNIMENTDTIPIKNIESKMSNYKAFLAGGTKLSKSPGRPKGKTSENARLTANSTLKLLNKEKEEKNNEEVDDKEENNKLVNDEGKKKKITKNNEKEKEKDKTINKYKDVVSETYDLDENYIKKCLNDGSIDSDIKIFKKMYIENVPKEFYPIRNIRKKLQYWNNGHMNDDITGNYIKDTIVGNIEKCYMAVNNYNEYQDNVELFIRNQEYINRMSEQKYKERFLMMIIDIIKI